MANERILTVDSFDLADFIIDFHKKHNITLSLCKLQTEMFFFHLTANLIYIVPKINDNFILKYNFIFLPEIEHKFRKFKKHDIAKLERHLIKASFYPFGQSYKFLDKLIFYLKNHTDKRLRELIRKTPIYKQMKKENQKIVTITKKTFIEYCPLKTINDMYNMIYKIDNII